MPFAPAIPASDERLIVNIEGRTKRGKTSLGLTFPRPLFALDLDHGIRELFRIRPELAKGVQLAEYHLPEEPTIEQATAVINTFLKDYQEACEEAASEDGTVLVDTGTQAWQAIQKAKLDRIIEKRMKEAVLKGEKNPDPDLMRIFPYDYRDANALMTAILQRPHMYDRLNAVFIHRYKEEYNGPNPSGRWVYQGFGNVPDLVQANIALLGEEDGTNLRAVIGYNRWRRDLIGTEFSMDDDEPLTYEMMRDMFLRPPKRKR